MSWDINEPWTIMICLGDLAPEKIQVSEKQIQVSDHIWTEDRWLPIVWRMK